MRLTAHKNIESNKVLPCLSLLESFCWPPDGRDGLEGGSFVAKDGTNRGGGRVCAGEIILNTKPANSSLLLS